MATSTPGFRTLSPALQRFFAATVINMIGSGALFGFVLIYFHEVRHIPLGQAGLAVGAMSFMVVLCTPVAGFLSDRFGARKVLTMGCVVSIVAGGLFVVVDSFAAAVATSALLGLGNALWFPAQSALLSLIVQPHERPTVSAFQRVALNIGAALGGAFGGFLVRDNSLRSFQLLFAINVATYLVFLSVLPALPSGRVAAAAQRGGPGFRDVLRDRFFVMLLGTDVAVGLGFGFLFAFMPVYASSLGIDKGTIGLLFMLGAVAVTVTQVPVLRAARGRQRMNALALMNIWFVAAFALMALTPQMAVGTAVVAIAVAQVLGGFGESVMGAVRQPLTSDLAPPELVGRYFGLAAMVFQGCMGLANAIGGAVMDHSRRAVWLIPLVASVAGVVGSLALRRRIPAPIALSA